MASAKQSVVAAKAEGADSIWNDRWKLAVLLGVPVALIGGVVAYRYLKKRNSTGSGSKGAKDSSAKIEDELIVSHRNEKGLEAAPRKVNSAASVDDLEEDDTSKSLAERALALKNRGNKFYKAGKYERAIEYYSKAISLFEPSEAESSSSQKAELERVTSDKEKEDMAILYQNRAASLEQLGERAKALDDCDAALRWNSRYAKALLRRSHLLKDFKRLYEAFVDVTAACILERFTVQANVLESDALLKQVAMSNARRVFSAPDRACPFPARAFVRSYLQAFHNDVIMCDALAQREKPSETADFYTGILDALNAEEYEKADSLCTSFLQEHSDTDQLDAQLKHAKVQLLKATFTLLRGAARQSIADLQNVTDLLANVDASAIKIADSREGQDEQTLVFAHAARMTVSLMRINAALKRAGASLQAGENDEAERAFRDAESALAAAKKVRKNADRDSAEARAKLGPDHPTVALFLQLATSCIDSHSDLFHQRAEYLLMTDRLSDALADFDKALQMRPQDSVVKSQRAFSAYRLASAQRDYESIRSAMHELDQLAKNHSGCAETASLGAQVHYDATRYDEADKLFARAIAIETDNPSNYVHRGLLALRRIEAEMMFSGMPPPTGEPSAVAEAERFFSEALKVDANCQFALEALGSLELQRGNVSRAVELFDRAIAAARSEQELAHLFELREAADVHRAVRERYGVSIDPAALLAAAQANAAAFEVPPD